jgi:hypothetical protein
MTVHHPHFTIIDGIVGQEGFVAGVGVCGSPVRMNTIIAGKDFVAVDAVGAYVMGMDPSGVNHIRYSHEMGLGEARIGNIRVTGEDPDRARREFRPAIPDEIGTYENITIVEGGSCSGCSFALRWTLNAFDPRYIGRWEKTIFFVGSTPEPPERIEGNSYLIGKCACRLPVGKATKVTGCPPPFWYFMGQLKKANR